MNPILVSSSILVALCLFTMGLGQRLRSLRGAAAPAESRFDRPATRLRRTLWAVLGHEKVRLYPLSGFAHLLVFFGFIVLSLRSLILIGRGFDPGFNAGLFAPGTRLGDAYGQLKDLFLALTLLGTLVFGYQRIIRRAPRLTLNREGLVILGLIGTMMLADVCYDSACLALLRTAAPLAEGLLAPFTPTGGGDTALAAHPIGATVSSLLIRSGTGFAPLVQVAQAGYYLHVLLLCVFLVLIPRSKHLHILAAPLNIYTSRLGPTGELPVLAKGTENLIALVEIAAELPSELDAPVGVAKLEHLTWKDRLDLLSCTECGRCEDHCPAARSGLPLSPKGLTLALRGAMHGASRCVTQELLPDRTMSGKVAREQLLSDATHNRGLVPGVISTEALWACTTCGACEHECPVGVTVVNKVVQMRRHLVTMRGELPEGLGRPFEALATNHNPWNHSPLDRLRWADGLDIPLLADTTGVEVLLWVGCAPAYDPRAQRVARSVALLLTQARVRFAVLGVEERCTGDAARRCGNEMLFLELAEANIATLEGYRAAGRFRRIVTLCPHCHNSLQNEYAQLGGHFQVTPHSTYLLELVESGRLVPSHPIARRLTFHDPCYLTRHSRLGEAPRQVLRGLPGVELSEVLGAAGVRAGCCGGGGGQNWLDQRGTSRTNERRARQLADTGASIVVTACPFCMGMITDGMSTVGRDPPIVRDLAELLLESCSESAHPLSSASPIHATPEERAALRPG